MDRTGTDIALWANLRRRRPRPGLKTALVGLFLSWLFPVLACNFPTATSGPAGLSGNELRQTMNAMEQPTHQAATETAEASPVTPAATLPGGGEPTTTPSPPLEPGPGPHPGSLTYPAHSGDTLIGVARRFAVEPDEITSPLPLSTEGYIQPGQLLHIPVSLDAIPRYGALLPDSEVILSPTTADFDIEAFVHATGGYLSSFQELVDGEWFTGAQIVQRVVTETSTNPRLLLAFLEYRSGWVLGNPPNASRVTHPIGFYVPGHRGLYKELSLSANHLNIALYDWRIGKMERLRFKGGSIRPVDPTLNAGSIALQNLFSKFFEPDDWAEALYGSNHFLLMYREMFGDPWVRAAAAGPLLHPDVMQPELEFPFQPGETWSFTGGPHKTWNLGSPLGALDLGPAVGEGRCAVSRTWVTAPAAGVVVRSQDNIVTLDLDGDGYEGTGWVLFFYHVADRDRVAAGTRLEADDPIGHASCEGGSTTGTHVHIARRYNGEWLAADGPIPFVLSGWRVHAGERQYEGTLVKGNETITANPGGSLISIISR